MIATHLFSVNKERKEFVAEDSTLRANGCYESLGRVLAIRNSATGRHAEFAYVKAEHDGEGEILCWQFEPTDASLRAHPALRGWRVTVLND